MQITTLPKDDVKRGEIYYISRGGYNTGSEQQADRPGDIMRRKAGCQTMSAEDEEYRW